MYGLRRLQVGRCGELTEGLSSHPTVARVVTREHRCGRGTLPRQNRKATPAGAARAARRSGSEFAKRMSSGDARRRHRRSPRTRTPPNGSTSESASADRRGRGTLRQQSRKVTPAGAARAARRSGSEFAKRMSSGDARRRHRRSPRTRTPPNGSTSESASADRPGPGFRAAKSERPLRAQGPGDMPRF